MEPVSGSKRKATTQLGSHRFPTRAAEAETRRIDSMPVCVPFTAHTFVSISSMCVTPDQQHLLIVDADVHSLYSLHFATHKLTTLIDGSGLGGAGAYNHNVRHLPVLANPWSVSVDAQGRIIYANQQIIIRFDPTYLLHAAYVSSTDTTVLTTDGPSRGWSILMDLNGDGGPYQHSLIDSVVAAPALGDDTVVAIYSGRLVSCTAAAAPTPVPSAFLSHTLTGRVSLMGYKNGTFGRAKFRHPQNLVCDSRGDLYLADVGNHAIRVVSPATRTVSTLAGGAQPPNNSDFKYEVWARDGVGTRARFYYPLAVAVGFGLNEDLVVASGATLRRITTRDTSAGPRGTVTRIEHTITSYRPRIVCTQWAIFTASADRTGILQIVVPRSADDIDDTWERRWSAVGLWALRRRDMLQGVDMWPASASSSRRA